MSTSPDDNNKLKEETKNLDEIANIPGWTILERQDDTVVYVPEIASKALDLLPTPKKRSFLGSILSPITNPIKTAANWVSKLTAGPPPIPVQKNSIIRIIIANGLLGLIFNSPEASSILKVIRLGRSFQPFFLLEIPPTWDLGITIAAGDNKNQYYRVINTKNMKEITFNMIFGLLVEKGFVNDAQKEALRRLSGCKPSIIPSDIQCCLDNRDFKDALQIAADLHKIAQTAHPLTEFDANEIANIRMTDKLWSPHTQSPIVWEPEDVAYVLGEFFSSHFQPDYAFKAFAIVGAGNPLYVQARYAMANIILPDPPRTEREREKFQLGILIEAFVGYNNRHEKIDVNAIIERLDNYCHYKKPPDSIAKNYRLDTITGHLEVVRHALEYLTDKIRLYNTALKGPIQSQGSHSSFPTHDHVFNILNCNFQDPSFSVAEFDLMMKKFEQYCGFDPNSLADKDRLFPSTVIADIAKTKDKNMILFAMADKLYDMDRLLHSHSTRQKAAQPAETKTAMELFEISGWTLKADRKDQLPLRYVPTERHTTFAEIAIHQPEQSSIYLAFKLHNLQSTITEIMPRAYRQVSSRHGLHYIFQDQDMTGRHHFELPLEKAHIAEHFLAFLLKRQFVSENEYQGIKRVLGQVVDTFSYESLEELAFNYHVSKLDSSGIVHALRIARTLHAPTASLGVDHYTRANWENLDIAYRLGKTLCNHGHDTQAYEAFSMIGRGSPLYFQARLCMADIIKKRKTDTDEDIRAVQKQTLQILTDTVSHSDGDVFEFHEYEISVRKLFMDLELYCGYETEDSQTVDNYTFKLFTPCPPVFDLVKTIGRLLEIFKHNPILQEDNTLTLDRPVDEKASVDLTRGITAVIIWEHMTSSNRSDHEQMLQEHLNKIQDYCGFRDPNWFGGFECLSKTGLLLTLADKLFYAREHLPDLKLNAEHTVLASQAADAPDVDRMLSFSNAALELADSKHSTASSSSSVSPPSSVTGLRLRDRTGVVS